jgi:hypothetical protein
MATIWLHGLTGERQHCFLVDRRGADLVLSSDIALCGARVAKYGLGYQGSASWKKREASLLARGVRTRRQCANCLELAPVAPSVRGQGEADRHSAQKAVRRRPEA